MVFDLEPGLTQQQAAVRPRSAQQRARDKNHPGKKDLGKMNPPLAAAAAAVPAAVPAFEREIEEGNVEYKLKLLDPTPARLEQLVTQLKWRLAEGGGEALYEIGVEDDGALHGLHDGEMEASLATLRQMCEQLGAHMLVRHQYRVAGCQRMIAEVLVRMLADQTKSEVRVAFLGGAQSGKSTLLAALATGQLDNGHGSARTLIMRHVRPLPRPLTSRALPADTAAGLHMVASPRPARPPRPVPAHGPPLAHCQSARRRLRGGRGLCRDAARRGMHELQSGTTATPPTQTTTLI